MRRLRVLYVTDRDDAPFRYRVLGPVRELRASGAVASILRPDAPGAPAAVAAYDVVVLFRLAWDTAVAAVVAAARAASVPIVFDVDDLLFDTDAPDRLPFRGMLTTGEWEARYASLIPRLRRTFDAADAFLGSTRTLVEHAAHLGKPAALHPNLLPREIERLARVQGALVRALRGPPTLGYFSGSDTHDEDLASVADALADVLEDTPGARLLAVGHLALGARHARLRDRVVVVPYLDPRVFGALYAACHAVIAPLAHRGPFVDAKSALKFFEPGALGVPVVASPARELAAAIRHGETGWLADSPADWRAALREALDPSRAAAVGAAARREVLGRHVALAHRGELAATLRGFARESTAAEPRQTPLARGSTVRGPLGAAASIARAAAALGVPSRRAASREASGGAAGTLTDARAALEEARRSSDPRAAIALAGGQLLVGQGLPPPLPGVEVGARAVLADPGADSRPALPGELAALGDDPTLTIAGLSLDTAALPLLAVSLRAASSRPIAEVQVFVQTAGASGFREAESVRIALPADGVDRVLALDLTAAPLRGGRVTALRVDPLDARGAFRLAGVAALPRRARVTAGPRPPATRLPGEPTAAEAAITAVAGALGPGDVAEVEADAPPTALRGLLARATLGPGVEVESLVADAGGARARLVAMRPLPPVDVVVPVHGAAPLVRRCLASVREELAPGDRLVVVDDASPDPALVAELRALAAADPRVVLLENRENLGFLGTANRGMAHAAGRDVLLLNSDTELFEGALLGLRSAAHAHPTNGLVSPLSNNATLCSVPVPGVSNPLPPGVTAREIAALVRRGSPARRPELVTPHGFCLYLRADCLARVGLFDAGRFGRGFGEENDLGERAKALGYRSVLADDVYVWHEGKASFGEEGRALERAHATVLEVRHPGYHARVARYLEENPLGREQERLSRHLARRSHRTVPAPLFVLHADPFAVTPGGVEHCVRDLVAGLAAPRALLLYPRGTALEVAEVLGGAVDRAARYRFPLARAPERFSVDHEEAVATLAEVLDLFHVGAVHLHHLMFLPLRLVEPIRSRALPYSVTVHDYYPVCRSHNLLGPGLGAPCPAAPGCRGPAAAACQRALHRELGEPLPRDPLADLEEHRARSGELLRGADALVFPSRAALSIVGRAVDLDGRRCHVVPHALPGASATASRRPSRRPGPLRVALLGQIAYASKGAEDYLALARALRGASVELHVFGPTGPFGVDARLDEAAGPTPIVRHGEYRRADAVSALVAADVDVGVLLPIWPETFSYTLSEFLAAGVPVVARRIGALAERLEGAPGASLVDGPGEAASRLRALAAVPGAARDLPAPRSVARCGRREVDAWIAWHAGLVAALLARSPRRGPGALDARGHARLDALLARSDAPPAVTPGPVTRPAARFAGARWYPLAARLGASAPESLRQLVRRRLAADDAPTLLRIPLHGPRARPGGGLVLCRRYLGTALYEARSDDPQLHLAFAPFDPAGVAGLRLNLWVHQPGPLEAKLYFQGTGDDGYDEARAFRIPLAPELGRWQEYRLELSSARAYERFVAAGPIIGLRLDPMDAAGVVGLGALVLAGPARKAH